MHAAQTTRDRSRHHVRIPAFGMRTSGFAQRDWLPQSCRVAERRVISAVAWAGLLSVAAAAHAQDCGEWIVQAPAAKPAARAEAALCFAAHRGRAVLFGGRDNALYLGDTWEWDGSTWARCATDGPAPRCAAALAYDEQRHVCVLFGGRGYVAGQGTVYYADTWEWDGQTWLRVAESGPSARNRAAAAYDAARGVVVLFGGQREVAGSALYLGDTWEWDGAGWMEQTGGPTPRAESGLAWDAARGCLVLFGGSRTNGGSLEHNSETWERSGTTWSLRTTGGPQPRSGFAFTADRGRGVITLYGGYRSYNLFGDTWEWNGSGWVQRQATAPAARCTPAATYDVERGLTLVFGGWTGATAGDTWLWDGDALRITAQPADQSAAVGSDVSFSVVATGQGTIHYRWRREGTPLSDGGRISGAETAILTIADVIAADAGAYDVVLTAECGTLTSRPARLTVLGGRLGDMNCDAQVNFGDITPFVFALSDPAGWQSTYPGCPITNGDCNNNGTFGFDDINPFVALLSAR